MGIRPVYSAGIDFSRQNLTSTDVRFWRLKSIPALEGLGNRWGQCPSWSHRRAWTLKRMKMYIPMGSHKKTNPHWRKKNQYENRRQEILTIVKLCEKASVVCRGKSPSLWLRALHLAAFARTFRKLVFSCLPFSPKTDRGYWHSDLFPWLLYAGHINWRYAVLIPLVTNLDTIRHFRSKNSGGFRNWQTRRADIFAKKFTHHSWHSHPLIYAVEGSRKGGCGIFFKTKASSDAF